MENLLELSKSKNKVGLTYESETNFTGGYNLYLNYRGEKVASCSLNKSRFGYAEYSLDVFNVDYSFRRGNPNNLKPEEYFGFGSELIEFVNEFIKQKNFSAYLVDGTSKEFKGFYKRHGWVEHVEGNSTILVFNKK